MLRYLVFSSLTIEGEKGGVRGTVIETAVRKKPSGQNKCEDSKGPAALG